MMTSRPRTSEPSQSLVFSLRLCFRCSNGFFFLLVAYLLFQWREEEEEEALVELSFQEGQPVKRIVTMRFDGHIVEKQ